MWSLITATLGFEAMEMLDALPHAAFIMAEVPPLLRA